MEYKNYDEIEKFLNKYDWNLINNSNDGRIDSLNSETPIAKLIVERLGYGILKEKNRDSYDIKILNDEDIKIVEPNNFTNTVSFTKLSSMLNLTGKNFNTICESYVEKKLNGDLKLVSDYYIIYINKENKEFTIRSLTELPIDCITVNPSNCIQTKIPKTKVLRNEEEKFNLILQLFIEYINKRILFPAKKWESAING